MKYSDGTFRLFMLQMGMLSPYIPSDGTDLWYKAIYQTKHDTTYKYLLFRISWHTT